MNSNREADDLLRLVARDLRPVRPLAPPSRRALALVPVGIVLMVGAPLLWGWRSNLAALGLWGSWGVSAVQTLVGLLIVGAALREAVPGRTLSLRALASTAAAAVGLLIAVTLLTNAVAPANESPDVWLRSVWECLGMDTLFGLPAVAVAVWLVARALPARPAVAGALGGLGVGVMADAGARLFCWVSTPAHVLVSHGGAVVFCAIAGAIASTAIDNAFAARRRMTIGRHRDHSQ